MLEVVKKTCLWSITITLIIKRKVKWTFLCSFLLFLPCLLFLIFFSPYLFLLFFPQLDLYYFCMQEEKIRISPYNFMCMSTITAFSLYLPLHVWAPWSASNPGLHWQPPERRYHFPSPLHKCLGGLISSASFTHFPSACSIDVSSRPVGVAFIFLI